MNPRGVEWAAVMAKLPELPSPNIKRWLARHKAAVVIAVWDGRLLREEACRRYQLSEEELLAWENAFKVHGISGLQATRLKIFRHFSQGRAGESNGDDCDYCWANDGNNY
jgi:hypothetical protein